MIEFFPFPRAAASFVFPGTPSSLPLFLSRENEGSFFPPFAKSLRHAAFFPETDFSPLLKRQVLLSLLFREPFSFSGSCVNRRYPTIGRKEDRLRLTVGSFLFSFIPVFLSPEPFFFLERKDKREVFCGIFPISTLLFSNFEPPTPTKKAHITILHGLRNRGLPFPNEAGFLSLEILPRPLATLSSITNYSLQSCASTSVPIPSSSNTLSPLLIDGR